MNRCGECTLCCRLTAVPELQKPVGVWCQHCIVGSGCKIYNMKPPSCSNFECFWYTNRLSIDLRPDKCKVVIEKLIDHSIFLILVDFNRHDAWRKPVIQSVIKSLLKSDNVVIISVAAGKEKHLLLPPYCKKTPAEIEQELRDYYQRCENINGSTLIHN